MLLSDIIVFFFKASFIKVKYLSLPLLLFWTLIQFFKSDIVILTCLLLLLLWYLLFSITILIFLLLSLSPINSLWKKSCLFNSVCLLIVQANSPTFLETSHSSTDLSSCFKFCIRHAFLFLFSLFYISLN